MVPVITIWRAVQCRLTGRKFPQRLFIAAAGPAAAAAAAAYNILILIASRLPPPSDATSSQFAQRLNQRSEDSRRLIAENF